MICVRKGVAQVVGEVRLCVRRCRRCCLRVPRELRERAAAASVVHTLLGHVGEGACSVDLLRAAPHSVLRCVVLCCVGAELCWFVLCPSC